MKVTAMALVTLLALAASTASAQYRPGPPSDRGQYRDQQQGPGEPWGYQNGQSGVYRPEWDRRPPPRRGACFFTDSNFNGHRFCVRAGDRLPALPEGYGRNISSIRTFGGATVTVFARRDFQGQRADFRDAPDLGFTSRGRNRGWNDRIGSIAVQ